MNVLGRVSEDDAAPAASEEPPAAGARLERVAKRYEDTPVLTDLVLEVPERAFMVLVGPSGCGKTTCLRLLAGLESPDEGRVLIGDRDVTRVPSRDRDIAMVFQDFALYPHMTVEANIAFGLRLRARHERGRGPSRREIHERVGDVIRLLELDGLEGRRPVQLSGGQRQRVALARAIVRRPRVFLMDEPLSNLDAQLRAQTRAELVQLHRRLAATVLYVTHDQVEAMSMATTMAVMDKGAILQAGAPGEIYERPATVFVGRFVGSPPMNVHHVDSRADTDATVVEGTGISGVLPSTGSCPVASVGWRPPHGRLHALEAGQERAHPLGGLRLRGRVETRELLGEELLIGLSGSWGNAGVLYPTSAPQPAVGALVTVDVPGDRVHQFAASGRRCT